MAEIKSTLDLVMERTRHLTLSPEEKQRQQVEGFDRRIQGLLQRYADGALTAEALQTAIAAMQDELGVSDRQRVVEAVVERIDPDTDNTGWMELLAAWVPAARDPVEAALGDHARHRAAVRQAADERWADRLQRDHGVAGTAVIPNGVNDATGREQAAALRLQTRSRIRDICRQTD
jgi:hypothetical protein